MPAIFISGPCTPCVGDYVPHDECLGGLHPPNIHRWTLYPSLGRTIPYTMNV